MLKMKKGSKVPSAEKLEEGYELEDRGICANVDADKIGCVLRSFLQEREEPVFFFLELPSRRLGGKDSFYNDVYYLDGCGEEDCMRILDEYGELLIADGMSSFGFGGHFSQEEIVCEKYNIVRVFTQSPRKRAEIFERCGIFQKEPLVLAWDLFTEEHPGESRVVSVDGKTVYDLPDLLKERGLYFAERRKTD